MRAQNVGGGHGRQSTRWGQTVQAVPATVVGALDRIAGTSCLRRATVAIRSSLRGARAVLRTGGAARGRLRRGGAQPRHRGTAADGGGAADRSGRGRALLTAVPVRSAVQQRRPPPRAA